MIDRYTQLQLVLKSLKISTKIGREVSKCKKFPEFADQDLKPECVSFKIIGFSGKSTKIPPCFMVKKTTAVKQPRPKRSRLLRLLRLLPRQRLAPWRCRCFSLVVMNVRLNSVSHHGNNHGNYHGNYPTNYPIIMGDNNLFLDTWLCGLKDVEST